MKRLDMAEDWAMPYVSHSLNQDVIRTSDGNYLFVNQGDAYPRGFILSKISDDGNSISRTVPFHFREGADRSYGYNETFAQYGGICETANGYVLCGSSERTLSLDYSYSGGKYYSPNEARDLFIQVIKKDFKVNAGQLTLQDESFTA